MNDKETLTVVAGAAVTKGVPSDSVVGGVSAGVICVFEDYVNKREKLYPKEPAPKHQEVSDELAVYMRDCFAADRSEWIQ